MQEPSLVREQPKSAFKRYLSMAKYPIAIAILIYVLGQADIEKIVGYVLHIPPLWLLLSFVFFTLAQILSTMRMNYYYRTIERRIELRYSLVLYYVGLFYNIILPGGIGGDAYKVYLLKKVADYPVRQGIRIQLLTRANGLLILLLMLYVSACFMIFPWPSVYTVGLAVVASIGTIAAYFILSRRLLKEAFLVGVRALPYSLGVQGFNVLTMVALWYGLGGGVHLADCVFLFQLAAIAGMIPVTIGGLGIREFTFFYGADVINRFSNGQLDGEFGVTISLLVFAITAVSACIGLIWLGKIEKMKPCVAVSA